MCAVFAPLYTTLTGWICFRLPTTTASQADPSSPELPNGFFETERP
jgi:hypothetical protein